MNSWGTDVGLNIQALQGEEGVAVIAGNQVPDGAFPLAQAYAGHQFGHFTMLGDGRALLLGEQITPQGNDWIFSLKVREERHTPVVEMVVLRLDPCCVNISLAKLCMRLVFQRHVV